MRVWLERLHDYSLYATIGIFFGLPLLAVLAFMAYLYLGTMIPLPKP